MSAFVFKLIPEGRDFVPAASRHAAAIRKLNEFSHNSGEVEIRIHSHIEFIDQGENLEAIICPSCKERLEIDHFSDDDPIGDWWRQANIEADVHRGEDIFELNPGAVCRMPCCQAYVKFIDLEFDWPAGFARFELTVSDPDLETVSREQLQELEQILGCRLKLIRAHY